MRKNPLISPVIKWFGGKQQLLDELTPLFPKKFTAYCEPFLGSGTVLFWLQPNTAYVCDINPELIVMYETIRDQAEELITVLASHPNQENYYRLIRNWDRDKRQYGKLSRVQRAARMIYLSRTCYNGVYRVNSYGEFDTPFGHYKKVNIVDAPVLRAVSAYLKQTQTTFYSGDYTKILPKLQEDAFVYFDPPYDTLSNKTLAVSPVRSPNTALRKKTEITSFRSTFANRQIFDRSEQIRLRRCCDELNKRGVKFMLSNLATDFILEQYESYFITRLKKYPAKEHKTPYGSAEEIVIRNYC